MDDTEFFASLEAEHTINLNQQSQGDEVQEPEKGKFDIALSSEKLPDKGDKGANKGTIANLKALFKGYGINCHYNEISKNQVLSMSDSPELQHDLEDNANYAVLRSLLALNNMPQSTVDLLPQLMRENTINPILAFIKRQPYQNDRDYFREIADSLEVAESDKDYRDLALKTWFFQCVAAPDSAKKAKCKGDAKFEHVLVIQGEQGLGKTTWFKSLVPSGLSAYVLTGEHLDPDDKDSLRRCLSAWICELGELDATFKKADVERLKAFLSQSTDKIRLPYDRAVSNYARRTSFAGSVNPEQFLVDKTGNRRYLTLSVKSIKRLPTDDNFLQQFWAQIWHEYTTQDNAIWWPSEQLKAMMEERHKAHTTVEPFEELLADKFDLTNTSIEPLAISRKKHYTTTKALIASGIPSPTKKLLNDATAFLKNKGFIHSKMEGVNGFWLAEKTNGHEEW